MYEKWFTAISISDEFHHGVKHVEMQAVATRHWLHGIEFTVPNPRCVLWLISFTDPSVDSQTGTCEQRGGYPTSR